MYLLYNLLIWLGSPFIALWVGWRSGRGRLPGLAQRLGNIPELGAGGAPVIWLHAVSLGEAKVAGALAGELRSKVPGLRCVFTASTRTGYEEAHRQAAPSDLVLFPPLDYGWVCRRFLRKLRPQLVLVLETELWPNLFREVKRSGAHLLLVNGRISDRSFARYKNTRLLWRHVLAQPDLVYARSAADAARFIEIGARQERVKVARDLKYAVRPAPSPFVESLQKTLREADAGPVLVAGSTMPGEEQHMLDAYLALRREFPRLWMILAPRHPRRCRAVAEQIRALGIPFQIRSEWRSEGAIRVPGLLLLDSTGELASLYQLATAAFVGGTLVPTGGHNILEPARFGCPTVIGPSMENFPEMAAEFLNGGSGSVPGEGIRTGAVVQVPDTAGLILALRYLLSHPEFARQLGNAAREVFQRQLGGMDFLLNTLQALLQCQPVGAEPGEEEIPALRDARVNAERLQQSLK
jgi:3-deoxy-D-manno-octulosonic-acid transferase